MFDIEIVRFPDFISLTNSTKALYFLLGMEADNWGFVDPNFIMRMYGGFNDDDLNVLLTRGFLIPFKMGITLRVTVITDWHKNNWLDSRRQKPTEYQKELECLTLNEEGQYMKVDGFNHNPAKTILLSKRLAFAKRAQKSKENKSAKQMLSVRLAEAKPLLSNGEVSIEESRIEENSKNINTDFSNEKSEMQNAPGPEPTHSIPESTQTPPENGEVPVGTPIPDEFKPEFLKK